MIYYVITRTNIRQIAIFGGINVTGFLKSSMEQKKKIMIYYMDSKGKVSQRIIRVVEMNDKKMLAYCYYRRQVRSFKLDNILSCGNVKRSVGA